MKREGKEADKATPEVRRENPVKRSPGPLLKYPRDGRPIDTGLPKQWR
jgi:hypothetical protein